MMSHLTRLVTVLAIALGCSSAFTQSPGPPPEKKPDAGPSPPFSTPYNGSPNPNPYPPNTSPPSGPYLEKVVGAKTDPNVPKIRKAAWTLGQLPQREGVVTKVTDDAIELREGKGEQVLITRFPAHDALVAGKVQESASDLFAYRLKDVKVNDVVILGVATEGGKEYCGEICIRERPGGKIPESQKPNRKPYHLKRQAELDEQQKGIPIPEILRGRFHGMTPAEIRRVVEQEDKAEANKVNPDKNPPADKKDPVPDTIPKSK